MTQNDIAYYNARNERRDARLKRKEAKRHNLESEALQKESNAASMLGSQARMISAQASMAGIEPALLNAQANAQNAATRANEYQLDWEREYGWSYGTPESVMNNSRNYHWLDNNSGTGILVPDDPTSPQSYYNAVRNEQYTKQRTSSDTTGQVRTLVNTVGDIVKIFQG